MAASIGWYDTDDSTPLTAVQLGVIPPGSSYFDRNGSYVELRAKNDGTEDFASVDVEIQQAGAYDGYEDVRIAPDDGGSAGVWQAHGDNPLALGAMVVDAVVPVWLDVTVPGGTVPDTGQTSNLVLIATT